MPKFEKGHKKLGGREPGSQNALTKTVKETVLAVFNELQQDPKNNLKAFGEKYPRDFYQIAAKLIPTEIQAKVSKIQLEIVRDSSTTDKGTSSQAEDSNQSG